MKTIHLLWGAVGVLAAYLILAPKTGYAELPNRPPPPPPPPPPPDNWPVDPEPRPNPTPIDPEPRPPPPPVRGPFSDLPIGTRVNRKGWPTGFFEPKWKIVAKRPPKNSGFSFGEGWNYDVVASPPGQFQAKNDPFPISESDISGLAD